MVDGESEEESGIYEERTRHAMRLQIVILTAIFGLGGAIALVVLYTPDSVILVSVSVPVFALAGVVLSLMAIVGGGELKQLVGSEVRSGRPLAATRAMSMAAVAREAER